MQVVWQGVDRDGEVKVEISSNDFLRSPENIGGVAGCRWGGRL